MRIKLKYGMDFIFIFGKNELDLRAYFALKSIMVYSGK